MKLKNVITALLTAALTISVVSLSGCSDERIAENKVKITIWSNDRSEMDVREKQINEFNASHDDIEIVYEVKSDNYGDLIKVACESNTAPDIFTYNDAVVRAGYAKPFDEDLENQLREEFLPGTLKKGADGKSYAVALKDTAIKFIWNKDLFREAGLDPEKPPISWDEVISYAKTITAAGNGVKYGFALPFKDSVWSYYYIMIPSAVDGNFNYGGFDTKQNNYSFDCYKPMLEIARKLKDENVLFPSPATLDNDTVRAQFAVGNIGMLIAESWDVSVLNDQFNAKCDWGVTDLPTVTGTKKGGYPFGYGGSAYSMYGKSSHEKEQKEVYKWLMSEEVLKELSLAGKGPYTMRSLVGDEYVPEDVKGAKDFAKRTKPYVIIDVIETPTLKLEGDNYEKAFAEAIISDKNFDEVINDLNTRYNEAYDKFKRTEIENGRDPERFHRPNYDYAKGE